MEFLESGHGIVSLAQSWLSIKRLEVIYQMMPCLHGVVEGDAVQPITPHAHGTGSVHNMQHSHWSYALLSLSVTVCMSLIPPLHENLPRAQFYTRTTRRNPHDLNIRRATSIEIFPLLAHNEASLESRSTNARGPNLLARIYLWPTGQLIMLNPEPAIFLTTSSQSPNR